VALALKILNENVTGLSGSVFHKFVAFGTNKLWKAFVWAKDWWRRNCLSVRWQKLGLNETMSGGK